MASLYGISTHDVSTKADGTIHGTVSINGVDAGRWSCSDGRDTFLFPTDELDDAIRKQCPEFDSPLPSRGDMPVALSGLMSSLMMLCRMERDWERLSSDGKDMVIVTDGNGCCHGFAIDTQDDDDVVSRLGVYRRLPDGSSVTDVKVCTCKDDFTVGAPLDGTFGDIAEHVARKSTFRIV